MAAQRTFTARSGYATAGRLLKLFNQLDRYKKIKTHVELGPLQCLMLGNVQSLVELCRLMPANMPIWYTRFPATGIPGNRRGLWHGGKIGGHAVLKDRLRKDVVVDIPSCSVRFGIKHVSVNDDYVYVTLQPATEGPMKADGAEVKAKPAPKIQAAGSPTRAQRNIRV